MKHMFSIGITTFKRRLKSVEDMISYLKSCDDNIIINLAINGEVVEDFDEDYIYLDFEQPILEFLKQVKKFVPESIKTKKIKVEELTQ